MSYRRMPSLPIVICFDGLKDAELGFPSGEIPFAMDEFDFQFVKETLGDGIIVAVDCLSPASA